MLAQDVLGALTLQRGAAIAGAAFFSYAFIVVLYRLFFHPLSKYPGPFWAKISGWPVFLHTVKQDRHVWLWKQQEKYGSTFRAAPDLLIVNTPTAHKQIYNAKSNIDKGPYYSVYPRNLEAITTFNATSRAVHARKRRVLNSVFSDRALRSFEPFVHENLDRWFELIGDEVTKGGEWSGSLDMAAWSSHLIFDILGDLCFGKSFGMKEHDSTMRYAPDLLGSFMALLHAIASSPFMPFWVWLKPRGLNGLLNAFPPAALANWTGFVVKSFEDRFDQEEEAIKRPKPGGQARKDFFHYLYSAVDPVTGEHGYTKDELLGETEMLMVAGGDTTATSTAAACFYLVRYPAVQTRLVEELRKHFATLDEIKAGTKLQGECKYLQAFIKEILRSSPPAPTDIPRRINPGGCIIDGTYVPGGITATSSIYGMHHNKDLYDSPFEFRPERWIVGEKGSTAESVARAESGYIPFSGGPSGCAGKNLAYQEMSLVIAKMVYQFELRQDPENKTGGGSKNNPWGRHVEDQYQLRDVFVALRDGPFIQFKRRV